MKEYAINDHKAFAFNGRLDQAIGVLFFVLATALGAYVRIPIAGSPVPITLQTFFVLLSGAFLGRRLGGLSQFAYLILGAAGLPIFQGAGFGAAYLAGPTTGYLIGFIIAAYLVGCMISFRPSDIKWAVVSFVAGNLTIYAFGTIWLILVYRMSAQGAISAGALPFIPGDMVKIALAAIIYSGISRRAKGI